MRSQINPYHHLLFWALFSLSFAVLEWGYNNTFSEALELEFIMLPVRLLAVYINWVYLIPILLYQGAIKRYLLAIVALLISVTILHRILILYLFYPWLFPDWVYLEETETFLENGVSKERVLRTFKVSFWQWYNMLQSMIVITIPVLFTTGWRFLLDVHRERQRTQQLEQEKTGAELKYLRSQVNPHFLFNTLNNIYGLARERSDKVPELILKLSDLLHYSLYETQGERIELAKELNLIELMMDLEKDRYGERVEVHLQKPERIPDLQIAPLLLVPLVENAFKHGVRNELEKAVVDIEIRCKGTIFNFNIRNTISAAAPKTERHSGLGLENLQKRLELIYPGRYEFLVTEEEGWYKAQLKLQLEFNSSTSNSIVS